MYNLSDFCVPGYLLCKVGYTTILSTLKIITLNSHILIWVIIVKYILSRIKMSLCNPRPHKHTY